MLEVSLQQEWEAGEVNDSKMQAVGEVIDNRMQEEVTDSKMQEAREVIDSRMQKAGGGH